MEVIETLIAIQKAITQLPSTPHLLSHLPHRKRRTEMLVKFFNRGTGKGQTAVEYLLKENHAKGIKREPRPEIIAGDSKSVINLIDSLNFKHKYRNGVISFEPPDWESYFCFLQDYFSGIKKFLFEHEQHSIQQHRS